MIKYFYKNLNSESAWENSYQKFGKILKLSRLDRADGIALQKIRVTPYGNNYSMIFFIPCEKKKLKDSQRIRRKQKLCYYNNLIVEDYDKFAKQMQDRLAINFHLPVANDII